MGAAIDIELRIQLPPAGRSLAFELQVPTPSCHCRALLCHADIQIIDFLQTVALNNRIAMYMFLLGIKLETTIDISMWAGAQVLAASQGGVANATSGLEVGAGKITVNISDSRSPDGSRAGLLGYHGTTYRAGPEQFRILADETEVHLRVLVDRVVVEVFAQHGRAQIAAHEWGAKGDTAVHMRACGSDGAVVSYEIFAMGCGWEQAISSPSLSTAT